MTTFVDGLREIVADYQALIIDQWGVLHGGAGLYRGAQVCLEELRKAGKQTLILTNSSKSDTANVARLGRMGLARDCYTHLLSSAQIMHDKIAARHGPPWSNLGSRAFVVAAGEDASLLDDLDLELVSEIDEAQFVILLSVDGNATSEAHQGWLKLAAKRDLPLIGPSRDAQSVASTAIYVGLGALCDLYESLGGRVTVTGKPEDIVYRECERLLGEVDPSQILVIGDQPGSDILGGHRQGYHGALVCTGAAAAGFDGAEQTGDWVERALRIASQPGEVPQWVLPRLSW